MRRYLVVANQTLGGQPLADEIRGLMLAEPTQFHLVVPATHPRHHLTWTEGEAAVIAADRLADVIQQLRELGADVDGEVGDANPVEAVGDALRSAGPFDAIVVSTFAPGLSRWLRQDLPHRLERVFGLPVTHIAAEVVEHRD